MNKLNCFFMLMFMSFSALAEDPGRIITLVPANRLDVNPLVQDAVRADCENQNNPDAIGAFQVDLAHLDLAVKNAINNRDSEFEVNGQRFVPVMGPQLDDAPKPRVNLVEGENGFLALSPTGLKFQVGNVSGKVDGKRIKFTVPIR